MVAISVVVVRFGVTADDGSGVFCLFDQRGFTRVLGETEPKNTHHF